MTTEHPKPRRGRPPGTRLLLTDEQVARFTAHLSVSDRRHPLLTKWIAGREPRRLAGDLVEFMERALAGQDVALGGNGSDVAEPQYEVDMSGLMEWD